MKPRHPILVGIALHAAVLTALPSFGAVLTAPTFVRRDVPVFEGASGFGSHTTAGRTGNILVVTNLNPSGPGSLKAAIDATGPRTIVFEVGGTIPLTEILVVNNPYVTIAGHTAPSPGITIRGASLTIRTHDVLVQHLRVRVGDSPTGPAPDNRDALQIEDPLGKGVYNVVVDHCSFSWAVDENASLWYSTVHDITISNCIISEALQNSIHPKGPHSKGLIVGPGIRNVSLIKNLLAHNQQRHPLISPNTSVVLLNNLIYDYGDVATAYQGPIETGPVKTTIAGNVYITGPSSTQIAQVYADATLAAGSALYVSDNRLVTAAGSSDIRLDLRVAFDPITKTMPIWSQDLTAAASLSVETGVLTNVGARAADRDAVDQRIVGEVKTRTGKVIDSQDQVGGWPATTPTSRSLVLPADPGLDQGDGYTNLDLWLRQYARSVEVLQ